MKEHKMIDLNINSFNKKHHIIYYEWYLDIRGGGPTGYLANLLDGLNRCENNEDPLIMFDTDIKRPSPPIQNPVGLHAVIQKWFYQKESTKSFYINRISRYQKALHNNYVTFLNNYNDMFCNDELFSKINLEQTKTIHVHTPGDAVKVKNTLNRLGKRDIKIMLTCHTPEAASNEYYKSALEQGYYAEKAEEIRQGWKIVERKAFEYADILVFPSKEAMEPLLLTMEGFQDIVASKDIRFMATGAKKLVSNLTKQEAKKKYGVEGKFVVGYVGRHNEIKGYDTLQKAASLVLDQNPELCFLIGGAQGNAFAPLHHDRWIEAGWVNPADLFMALDVFILPNKMTYYDLFLLEVMSLGIPIIASRTGGNKSVQNLTNTLCLFDNTEKDLADKISMFSSMPSDKLLNIGKETYSAYEKYFTTTSFAQRYIDTINKIYMDYQLL